MKRHRKWPAVSERYKRIADASMTPAQLERWRDLCGANVKWQGSNEPMFYGIDFVNSGQPYPKYDDDNAARDMLRTMEAHGHD